ncbi:MAG TPA: hypothetical protein VHY08_09955 [Bacillota bacterium]|nr:hypothetical protein [Bacillota bacterium]
MMSKNALAVKEPANQTLQKSKPRYTEAENKILFDSWWNPGKRRELVNHLGRKMSALRSQFCRLLKEKGLTNQDYYNMMQSKYAADAGGAPRKRNRELKNIDRTILEVFCKHQAMGNSRTQACDELQKLLGAPFTPAALKLRFYRLVKRLQYDDHSLLKIGKQLLGAETPDVISLQDQNKTPAIPVESIPTEPIAIDIISNEMKEKRPEISGQAASVPAGGVSATVAPGSGHSQTAFKETQDVSFFYQLSSLPDTIHNLEERLGKIEERHRHQLDLKGFIEHLLAVERDLKREDKLLEEIQKLMDENHKIQNALEKDRERLKKREEELAEVYRMLETMLSDFMRLESVSKLASLGDFMHRLEVTVDQFGNVLKSKRVLN